MKSISELYILNSIYWYKPMVHNAISKSISNQNITSHVKKLKGLNYCQW